MIDLVDCKDIAAMVSDKVTPRTVRDRWSKRPDFPKPVEMPVRTRDLLWLRTDIENYLELPSELGR